MARRAPIQVNEEQWQAIKGKYGLENVTRDQFNTSLRDRRRSIRMSNALVKNVEESGISLNAYRRIVRSTKEYALTEKAAAVFEKAAFGDEISVRKAKFMIGGFRKSLEKMKAYDAEYVYQYSGGAINFFKFNLETHEVEITWSGGRSGNVMTQTYDISEAKGLSTVLNMAKTKEHRKVTEEISDLLSEPIPADDDFSLDE